MDLTLLDPETIPTSFTNSKVWASGGTGNNGTGTLAGIKIDPKYNVRTLILQAMIMRLLVNKQERRSKLTVG